MDFTILSTTQGHLRTSFSFVVVVVVTAAAAAVVVVVEEEEERGGGRRAAAATAAVAETAVVVVTFVLLVIHLSFGSPPRKTTTLGAKLRTRIERRLPVLIVTADVNNCCASVTDTCHDSLSSPSSSAKAKRTCI